MGYGVCSIWFAPGQTIHPDFEAVGKPGEALLVPSFILVNGERERDIERETEREREREREE